MTAHPQIVVERDGAVATVVLDRPDKLNALTQHMWLGLAAALADLDADDGVRAVVLTGRGPHFCAGSDIADLAEHHKSPAVVAAEDAIVACRKPVIASIAGYCLGGGLALAAACDLQLAATDSRYGVPPAKLGIVYPHDATRRLLALIGPANTKYLIFTADRIDATRALHIGLVDELVPPDLIAVRSQHVARRIAGLSQLTVQATKQIVDALTMGRESNALAASWIGQADAGPDLPEGIAAFGQRRGPNFTWTPGPRD